MIPNYSAQGYKLLTKEQKEAIEEELKTDGRTYDDWLAEIKAMWPKEVKLPKAKWGVR